MSKFDNTGGLWKNDKMRPDHKDPQLTGSAEINGVEYWVSAWHGDGGSKPVLNLKFNLKQAQRQPPQPAETPYNPQTDQPPHPVDDVPEWMK